MSIRLDLSISYGQLAVFASSLKQPFNDWADRHVSQGFAWRPGSVSFRTLEETGPHVVEIEVIDHVGTVREDAVRVIEVPFEVPADGAIEIGSISETVPVTLPSGTYRLRCEFAPRLDLAGGRVRLTFAKEDTPRFAIILADPELGSAPDLLTTADPASV